RGVIGARLPPNITVEQAAADARARGDSRIADLLIGQGVVPGQGVDFAALRNVLTLAVVVYVLAAGLGWLQGYVLNGTVQRSIFRLRADVEAKINRLPLAYFDRQPRGEVLSRVTNDIDNIGQSMQQTTGQVVNSLLTIVGVLGMMFWISPLLAVI